MHKNYIIYFCIIIMIALGLTGCEKVIDVDLNESVPAIVIEANLSFLDEILDVKITKTGSYFKKESICGVKHAEVYLKNRFGLCKRVKEVGEGHYQLKHIRIVKGVDYRLEVKVDNDTYIASSSLSTIVPIDSLSYIKTSEISFFSEGGYRILLYFFDPPYERNYYRVKVYKNGNLLNGSDDLILFSDSGLDGKGIQVRLKGETFAAGDTAYVEMMSIDEKTWKYFSTLREVVETNPGLLAPSNPVSNFNNGALGYFSIWSHSSKYIIVKDKK